MIKKMLLLSAFAIASMVMVDTASADTCDGRGYRNSYRGRSVYVPSRSRDFYRSGYRGGYGPSAYGYYGPSYRSSFSTRGYPSYYGGYYGGRSVYRGGRGVSFSFGF